MPILIFSGLTNGGIMKWEALQSSQFIYHNDILPYKESSERATEIENEKRFLKN